MLKTEVVHNFDESIVDGISAINSGAFPTAWNYGNEKEYYRGMLKNRNNVCILLKDNAKTVGFILAIPHINAVIELKDDDPLMHGDASRYYIETIAILPEYRGQNGFSSIMEALQLELDKRGFHNISLHARVINNFSQIIQKKMKITDIRKVDKWKYTNSEEPVDYIEATFI